MIFLMQCMYKNFIYLRIYNFRLSNIQCQEKKIMEFIRNVNANNSEVFDKIIR